MDEITIRLSIQCAEVTEFFTFKEFYSLVDYHFIHK